MINELLLAIIQAATEYLPVSSSGHLALISNLVSTPDIFFFTMLHLASLFAVVFFLRKEIYSLITFKKETRKLWIYWIVATIPAALIGLLFNNIIEQAFSSYLFLGLAFLFTGTVLYFTKDIKQEKKDINVKSGFKIGLLQTFALFPGISRSGMTISAGLFQGVDKEQAARFSFLLFIPLSIGAFILEFLKLETFQITSSMIVSSIICFVLSLVFLKILIKIIKNNKFWMFSFYCWLIGILTLVLHFIL